MPKYNLNALGSEEFEHLCQSLVQQVIGPGAKVYGMGSDGSREVTFSGTAPYPSATECWDGDWIFQAKFHDVQTLGPTKARQSLLRDLDTELSAIVHKYKHPCDNFILMTNVPLTPVFQKGIKDKIDQEIVPRFRNAIRHIHVWGADELCRFLDGHPGVRTTYVSLLVGGDIVARLLGLVEARETDLDELMRLYCHGCFVHEQSAALDDAGDVEDKPVELERVFVDLDVKPFKPWSDPALAEHLPEWLKQATEDEERISALSYLLDDSLEGIVLVGGPGEGKSTLAQFIAQLHRGRLIGRFKQLTAGQKVLQPPFCRVPFRVLLKEYAQWVLSARAEPTTLFHYLAGELSRECGRNVEPEQVQQIVKNAPSLLILDGLDEVPEKALRQVILNHIAAFVNQTREVLRGALRVLATTRPSGYAEEFSALNYLHLGIQKLSAETAVRYAQLWTEARERNVREGDRILKTLALCLEDRVVSVLTQTPLQVTILLVIIRARGMPPKQREELFERYMDVIYQREQKKRPELVRTERDTIYGLHKYIAYLLHERAERDRTAALMDIEEFRERVEEYLLHCNPLLGPEKQRESVSQIIAEARDRFVLIESPVHDKVGFGLTTTREFFAACHLVDTASDTQARDRRFKAISRSPYWRNVALFFAGRVGRTRPGEAASMIDVCRQIDTEGVDKFLRRGAHLVMEILDDRALRVGHNEIGAVQCGISLLDKEWIPGLEQIADNLRSLPDEYKAVLIAPFLEERMATVGDDLIAIYAAVYAKVCGVGPVVKCVLRRAGARGSPDVQRWAAAAAIQYEIVEPWVVESLARTGYVPTETLLGVPQPGPARLEKYFDLDLDQKHLAALARATFDSALRFGAEIEDLPPHSTRKESMGRLYLSAVRVALWLCTRPFRDQRSSGSILVGLPLLADPRVVNAMRSVEDVIERFTLSFCSSEEVYTKFLIAFLNSFVEVRELERSAGVFREATKARGPERWLVVMAAGRLPASEPVTRNIVADISVARKLYQSEQDYEEDLRQFNVIVNRESRTIPNHPCRLMAWIECGLPESYEEFLDSEITGAVRGWLTGRDLSGASLHVRSFESKSGEDFEEFYLSVIRKEVLDGGRKLHSQFPYDLIYSGMREMQAESRREGLRRKIRGVWEDLLARHSPVVDPKGEVVGSLYWLALHAGVLGEEDLAAFGEIARGYPGLLTGRAWRWFRVPGAEERLKGMLRAGSHKVRAVAGLYLAVILEQRRFGRGERVLEEPWVSEALWELASGGDGLFREKCIRGLAGCRMRWAEFADVWLGEMATASGEELQEAWSGVVEHGGCGGSRDREALVAAVVRILSSGNTFPKEVRRSALIRLHSLVPEMEAVGFNQEALGLPLSRREKPIK